MRNSLRALAATAAAAAALFTGAALALQIHSGGERFQASDVVPAIVAIGMARELGPVLGGLMVAARVASAIAAELGFTGVPHLNRAVMAATGRPAEDFRGWG